MRITILLILLSVCSISFAEEPDNNTNFSMEKILAVSKMAGLCEAVVTMIDFQNTSKIIGSEEFMNKYVAYTANRKGLESKEFIKACSGVLRDAKRQLEVARGYDKSK